LFYAFTLSPLSSLSHKEEYPEQREQRGQKSSLRGEDVVHRYEGHKYNGAELIAGEAP